MLSRRTLLLAGLLAVPAEAQLRARRPPGFRSGLQFFGGGSELWTPDKLGTSLAAWLDASDPDTITLVDSAADSWLNKGSFGGTATATGVATRPLYSATGLNTRPALTFTGSRRLLLPFARTAGPSAILMVASHGGGVNALQSSDWGSTTGLFFGWPTGGQDWVSGDNLYSEAGFNSGSGPRVIAANPTDGAPHLVSAMLSAAAPLASLDGTELTTRVAVALDAKASTGTSLTIGGSSNPLSIAEVLIVRGALSYANYQRAGGYLAWKWGLEPLLPASHPYKFAAPTSGA